MTSELILTNSLLKEYLNHASSYEYINTDELKYYLSLLLVYFDKPDLQKELDNFYFSSNTNLPNLS